MASTLLNQWFFSIPFCLLAPCPTTPLFAQIWPLPYCRPETHLPAIGFFLSPSYGWIDHPCVVSTVSCTYFFNKKKLRNMFGGCRTEQSSLLCSCKFWEPLLFCACPGMLKTWFLSRWEGIFLNASDLCYFLLPSIYNFPAKMAPKGTIFDGWKSTAFFTWHLIPWIWK